MNDLTTQRLEEFLDQTASRSPTPGGGSVTAAAGALATALAQMVVAYSVSKKTQADVRAVLEQASTELGRVDQLLRALVTQDARVYSKMTAAAKEAKADSSKEPVYQQAVMEAVAVPMQIAALASQVLATLDDIKTKANKYLLSDLGIAAVLCEAAVRAARYTVHVNLPELCDKNTGERIKNELDTISQHSVERCRSIEGFVREPLER